jgi:hypothetical protein
VTRSAGLSFSAYDLAEWASLHPAAHALNPQMLPSLLLRMPLLLLAWMMSVHAGRPFRGAAWWLCAFAAAVLTAAQLPPFEFFTVLRDNTNYAQQFTLAVASFIGSLIGLSGIVWRGQNLFVAVFALMGLISSMVGYVQTADLMRGFNLAPQIGIGIIGWGLSCAAVLWAVGWRAVKRG